MAPDAADSVAFEPSPHPIFSGARTGPGRHEALEGEGEAKRECRGVPAPQNGRNAFVEDMEWLAEHDPTLREAAMGAIELFMGGRRRLATNT